MMPNPLVLLPLQTAAAVEFTIAPVVRGQRNGWEWVATAGAVELILRVYEPPLGIKNFVVFWRWEGGEFNRIRGCETSTGHFTPDDRGYGELNRSAIMGRPEGKRFMFDFLAWPKPCYDTDVIDFLPLQTAVAVEFTVAPVVRGQGNG